MGEGLNTAGSLERAGHVCTVRGQCLCWVTSISSSACVSQPPFCGHWSLSGHVRRDRHFHWSIIVITVVGSLLLFFFYFATPFALSLSLLSGQTLLIYLSSVSILFRCAFIYFVFSLSLYIRSGDTVESVYYVFVF